MANTYSEVSATFQDIADAIRDKGISGKMKPTQMAEKIGQIETGITPSGEKAITTTASTDVASYATAKVSDANLVAANIVSGKSILGVSGTAVVPSGNISLTATTSTQTGVNVTNYATASIAPTPSENKSVTSNGTVTPTSGKLLSQVTVNVPNGTETKNITENGTYTPTSPNIGFSSVTVNVSGGGSSGFITNKLNGQVFFASGDGSASHTYTTSKTVQRWYLWTHDSSSSSLGLTNSIYPGSSRTWFEDNCYGFTPSNQSSYPNVCICVPDYYGDQAKALIVNNTNVLNLTTWDQCYLGSKGVHTVYVTAVATDNTSDTDYFQMYSYDPSCFLSDTLITLADGSKKAAIDITYDDDLLVWDFDNSKFASAKPLWIKIPEKANKYNILTFEDGTQLKTVNDHRIFNKQSGSFTFGMKEKQTPLTISTFTDQDKFLRFTNREVVDGEEVTYCNIITDYYQNLFANGILTSCKTNNLYPVWQMGFDKHAYDGYAPNQIPTKQEYLDFGIDEMFIDGMRLCEFPQRLFREKDRIYFERLKNLMVPR